MEQDGSRKIKERIEDVFQDEIVTEFPRKELWEQFARSKHGLKLNETTVQHINDSQRGLEGKKLEMLNHWKATIGGADEELVAKIRQAVTNFRDHLAGSSSSPRSTSSDGQKISKAEEKLRKIELIKKLESALKTVDIEEAAEVITQIEELRGSLKFDELLTLAESEFHLNRGQEEVLIQRVKDMSSERESLSYQDVAKMAAEHLKNGQYVHVLILCKVSHDLSKNQYDSPDDEMGWIIWFQGFIAHSVVPLVNLGGSSRKIAERYGLAWMADLLDQLHAVKSDSKEKRVLKECSMLINMSGVSNELDWHEKTIDFCKRGLSLLEKEFGPKAVTFLDYGWFLHKMAQPNARLGHISEAKNSVLKSIDAYEQCTQFKDENEKKEKVDSVKFSYEDFCRQLEKINVSQTE